MTYARPFSFFADLKCSLREFKFSCLPLTQKCAHIVLGTLAHSCRLFFCNYFIIRCRNLREPLQDLRARDFQWLWDFFSPNICVAKFWSILFLFFVHYCFSIPSFFCYSRSSAANLNLSRQMRPIQLKFNCSVIDTIWDKLFSFQPIRREYLR